MAARHPLRRGDVVLVPFPFSGPTGQKDRPAVVLSTDAYHEDWDDVLVLAVTSRPPRTLRRTDCELQGWQLAGLSTPSWVRSHLATVNRQIILRRIGKLTRRDRASVEKCVRAATGL
jgi:mRNA interferase MazF